MNISHDGTTVSFKTEPEELFLAEKSGRKSNTVRVLDKKEYFRLVNLAPEKIVIQYQHEIFRRTISDSRVVGDLLGKLIVVLSWRDESEKERSEDGS